MSDENEVSLPRTTLQKMIKDFMPSELRVSNDAMEMLISCCTEFIQLVSSESNEVAMRESKTIIHPDHVIRALNELGFPEFVEEVNQAWDQFKEDTKTSDTHKAKLRKTGAEAAGLTEEEQIALQQQMFAAARAQSLTTVESAAQMHAAYEQALAQAQAQVQAQHNQAAGPQ